MGAAEAMLARLSAQSRAELQQLAQRVSQEEFRRVRDDVRALLANDGGEPAARRLVRDVAARHGLNLNPVQLDVVLLHMQTEEA